MMQFQKDISKKNRLHCRHCRCCCVSVYGAYDAHAYTHRETHTALDYVGEDFFQSFDMTFQVGRYLFQVATNVS